MNVEDKSLNYAELVYLVEREILSNTEINLSRPLKDHLLQRICQPLFSLIHYDEKFKRSTDKKVDLSKLLVTAKIILKNKSLKLNLIQQIRWYLILCIFTIWTVIYILFAKKLNSHTRLNLIYGMAHEHIYLNSKKINCTNFFERINPIWIKSNSQILIELRKINFSFEKSKDNFRIVNNISLYLLKFSSENRFRTISRIVKKFFHILKLSRKNSVVLLSGKEILLESSGDLVFEQIESLSTTVGQIFVQPYLFHLLVNTPKEMYWYSNNSKTFSKKETNNFEGDTSFYKFAKIDKHYVWTEDFGNELKKYTGKQFEVLDYVLFYDPTHNNKLRDLGILIFDVIPQKRYKNNTFYSENNCIKFLQDVLEVNTILNGKYHLGVLTLKNKRAFYKGHSALYIKTIKNLNKAQHINLLDVNSNLFESIYQAKIVIAMPYSTPALIAHRLGVSSCYYNPDCSYNLGSSMDGIEVIEGKENLLQFCKMQFENSQ